MKFVKMEGLGNDFVVLEGPLEPTPEQVVAWCDRPEGMERPIVPHGLCGGGTGPLGGRQSSHGVDL
ncbi:MAG: hypothetical protein KJN73_04240, partial [Acidimicrobiia bacterium]|nr:hypothetical protein [Acidimicrobiia bacterium]